ncbi:MAG: 16S rRNA (guanine(966)-N(2))-methyltransferase RsmD [Syntrophomonas sp.]
MRRNIKRRWAFLRVIAGKAKGKRLNAPRGMKTRPITDMIKEALFNVLGPGVYEAAFLDLFAGSGSVGIEALSRGAHPVFFVDNDRAAIGVILENIKNCAFSEGFEIYGHDVFHALRVLERNAVQFDYIYVDPPFNQESIFGKIMSALGPARLLAPGGLVILRTQRKMIMADCYENLSRTRINQYGESILHYYHVDKEEKGNDGDISRS